MEPHTLGLHLYTCTTNHLPSVTMNTLHCFHCLLSLCLLLSLPPWGGKHASCAVCVYICMFASLCDTHIHTCMHTHTRTHTHIHTHTYKSLCLCFCKSNGNSFIFIILLLLNEIRTQDCSTLCTRVSLHCIHTYMCTSRQGLLHVKCMHLCHVLL